jgi:acyl carrier protein
MSAGPCELDARILEGIRHVARQHLDWRGEIRTEERLVEVFALDSLRLLTLVVEIENRFRVALDEGSEAEIETVADLIAVIRRKLDERAADSA